MWLKEYIYNILIQPFHLLVYTILIGTAIEFATANLFYTLAALGFLVPAEKLLRKMFGFEKASHTMGQLGAATAGGLIANTIGKLGKGGSGGKGGKGEDSKDKGEKIRMKDEKLPNAMDEYARLSMQKNNQGKDQKPPQTDEDANLNRGTDNQQGQGQQPLIVDENERLEPPPEGGTIDYDAYARENGYGSEAGSHAGGSAGTSTTETGSHAGGSTGTSTAEAGRTDETNRTGGSEDDAKKGTPIKVLAEERRKKREAIKENMAKHRLSGIKGAARAVAGKYITRPLANPNTYRKFGRFVGRNAVRAAGVATLGTIAGVAALTTGGTPKEMLALTSAGVLGGIKGADKLTRTAGRGYKGLKNTIEEGYYTAIPAASEDAINAYQERQNIKVEKESLRDEKDISYYRTHLSASSNIKEIMENEIPEYEKLGFTSNEKIAKIIRLRQHYDGGDDKPITVESVQKAGAVARLDKKYGSSVHTSTSSYNKVYADLVKNYTGNGMTQDIAKKEAEQTIKDMYELT